MRNEENVPSSPECFARGKVRILRGEEKFAGSQVGRIILFEETEVGQGQQ
jgi:hypothetical protein